MALDPYMEGNDYVLGTDGNYEANETALGKMQRVIFSHLGRWPGGHGETMGNSFHERAPWKDTAEERERFVRDAEQALELLTTRGGLGVIKDPRVVAKQLDTGRWVFNISATDLASKNTIGFQIPQPWGS